MATSIECPPSQQVTLFTARLSLRAAKEEDAEPLFEAFGDPKVMKYWSELPHVSVARTSDWISEMISSPQNGTTDFIICLSDSQLPIGKIGIWHGDEIGFLLNARYWGKGLAQEALAAVLSYSFLQKGFETITADTDPSNEASIGLLKKFGFEVTSFKKNTFEIGGTWFDSCYLELGKSMWQSLAIPRGDPYVR